MKKIWLSLIVVLGFVGLCFGLMNMHADRAYIQQQQVESLLKEALPQIQAAHPEAKLVSGSNHLPPESRQIWPERLKKWQESHPGKGSEVAVQIDFKGGRYRDRLTLTPMPATGVSDHVVEASRTRTHWTSVLPPLVAVTIALITQRLVLSLFMGIFIGSILAADLNPLQGALELLTVHFKAAVGDFFHIQILLFAGFLLGMVGMMNVSGGTRGIIEALRGYIENRRSTKLMTSIMGLLVFFDDYANSFVIGTTMRPITDQKKISREKLAYIVDSTAAPVSGIAIISTWIGYEVGLFQTALDNLEGVSTGGYQAFIQAVPYRFYCLLALAMVFVVVILKRDFGPMYRAELRALEEGLVIRDGATPLTDKNFNGLDAKAGIPLRWQNAAFPVLAVILTTLGGLFYTGGGLPLLATPAKLFNVQTIGTVFSNASSGDVLLWSSIIGCVVSAIMIQSQKLLSLGETFTAWRKGVASIYLASIILVLAWMLNNVSEAIGTAPYLIAIFRNIVQPVWLPLLIFALSGAIAFSTGSSWSTMAILIPVAVPLAYEIGGPTLMIIAMGAVLDGSIFGDHCSPLSDTTILSSIACSCDHLDHVKTQLPYAMVVMSVAALCCYLPAAGGISPFLLIPGGVVALILIVRLIGRDPEADRQGPPPSIQHVPKTDPAMYMQES